MGRNKHLTFWLGIRKLHKDWMLPSERESKKKVVDTFIRVIFKG